MRVLVTGHDGYIGSILTRVLRGAGHDVTGVDNFMFGPCRFGEGGEPVPAIAKDIRDLEVSDLEGFEAVCHLAGISNDPVGDLKPEITSEINHLASVRMAEAAAAAGVSRYIFSSSCSIYGANPGGWVDEQSPTNPVTAYGWSKIRVEEDVSSMATDDFSPVFLRNATAYGMSPKLRTDLVVNNMVGYATTQGRVLMKSDGTPWRPLIHIEDISRAFLASLEAPREVIHNQIFNVGSSQENYQIRDVAAIVEKAVPGSRFEMADEAGPDIRDYRVDCSKIAEVLPSFQPEWNVARGVAELHEAFTRLGLSEGQFLGELVRIHHILATQRAGHLDEDLRVVPQVA